MNEKTASKNPWLSAKDHAIVLLVKASGSDANTVASSIEVPPDSALGDLATTIAFQLAKTQKKNPTAIATEIVEKLQKEIDKDSMIDRVESKGPYINLFYNRGEFANLTIESVNSFESEFGKTDQFKGKKAMIESPAVNPSKPWHIGHCRNAVLGDTLANILEAVGYGVVRIDYINNLGLQIAQLTWKLMQPDIKPPDGKYDHYLGHLYVDVQEAFEKDPKVEAEIREVARRLEDPDSPETKRSLAMVTDCVKEQNQTSYRLGIFHDYQIWESSIAHSGLLEAAREMMLKAENIVIPKEGDKAGCVVAKLDTLDEFKDMKEPNKVLFRSDGTRTYTGADVALQMWKFGIVADPWQYELFEEQPNGKGVCRTVQTGERQDIGKMDVVFNVVGSPQSQPQRLVYAILNILGYAKQSENSHHIAYEFVGLEDASFSGRKGTWVGFSTDVVLDRARELAREEVSKRNPDESDEFKDEVAEQVGSGAVRYLLLNASPDRKITFRWKEALDFQGDAAPYLQYSHARAQRILEKADSESTMKPDPHLLSSDQEFALVKSIARFPEEILDVVKSLNKEVWGTSFQSSKLTSYCYGLAMLFSKFYDSSPVLKAEPDIRDARLALVTAFKTTMANCLNIIGIPVVQRM
ncbi:MAG: arginine--tRNA ligase [Candidatus Thorarchaeota archaeon]